MTRSQMTVSRADEAVLNELKRQRAVARKLLERRLSVRLKCTGGVFRDAVFPADEREIVIGRGTEGCNIRYPADTPGVSRRHCSLRIDEDGYVMIRDLGSSQGTYFGDGARLNPNVDYRIRRGESFYLGSGRERFRVEMEETGGRK